MAEQATSPHEAEIARRKLAVAESVERARTPEAAWERRKRQEAEEESRIAAAREKEIARIVRQWERGAFQGITVRSGATLDHAFAEDTP